MSAERFYSDLGSRIAVGRRAAGLKQVEVAERTGLSRASIANIEAGKQRVFLDQAVAIAAAINLESLDSILPQPAEDNAISTMDSLKSAKGLSRSQERMLASILDSIDR